MQRDNKIAVLEGKLNSAPATTPKPSALKNVPKQKEITGKITKASESAEKYVVDSIKKRPTKIVDER